VWISEAFRLFPFLQQHYRSAIGKLKGEGEKKLRTRGEKDVKSQAMYQRRGEDQGEVTLQVRLKQGVSRRDPLVVLFNSTLGRVTKRCQ
jgi:hypothetical protein